MEEMLQELAEAYGWEYEVWYGLDGNFICPCGNLIEQDGACPKCGPSPARRAGLI